MLGFFGSTLIIGLMVALMQFEAGGWSSACVALWQIMVSSVDVYKFNNEI